MLILSLLWIVLGLFIGALANAAKLRPAAWSRGGHLGMLGLGALVAVLGVVLLPRLITWCACLLRAYCCVR